MKDYLFLLGEKNKKSKIVNYNKECVDLVVITTKRVSKYSFWRTKCFEEALTCKLLLKKKNIYSTIYFGVKKDKQELLAHAWLTIGEKVIIGGRIDNYTITSFFT